MPPKTGNVQTVEIDKPVRTKANQKSKQEGGMVVLVVVVRTEEGEARENISRVQAGSWTAAVRGGSVISRAVPGPKTRSLNPTCAVHPGSLASLGRCGELSVWGRMAVRWVSQAHLWVGDGQCCCAVSCGLVGSSTVYLPYLQQRSRYCASLFATPRSLSFLVQLCRCSVASKSH